MRLQEPALNPALEEQAIGRAWRMGERNLAVVSQGISAFWVARATYALLPGPGIGAHSVRFPGETSPTPPIQPHNLRRPAGQQRSVKVFKFYVKASPRPAVAAPPVLPSCRPRIARNPLCAVCDLCSSGWQSD